MAKLQWLQSQKEEDDVASMTSPALQHDHVSNEFAIIQRS